MKRIITKRWDETNGCLYANYYRIGEHMAIVQGYRSPIMRKSPADCKGMMSKYGERQYFGRGFIKEIAGILDNN